MRGILCATDVMEYLKLDTDTSKINTNLNSLFTVICGKKS